MVSFSYYWFYSMFLKYQTKKPIACNLEPVITVTAKSESAQLLKQVFCWTGHRILRWPEPPVGLLLLIDRWQTGHMGKFLHMFIHSEISSLQLPIVQEFEIVIFIFIYNSKALNKKISWAFMFVTVLISRTNTYAQTDLMVHF